LLTLFEAMRANLPLPNLIVSLEAPFEITVERIRQRDRAAERSLEVSFLRRIYDYYMNWLSNLDEIPTVAIDTVEYDFVNQPNDAAAVLNRINEALRRTSVAV